MATRPRATPRISGEAAALELERPLVAGLSPREPLAAHFYSPEGLVLLREPLAGAGGFFAGSLSSLSVEDVFAHVLSGMRTGQLIVQQGALRRTLFFREAQAIFATSTERHERLGQVVVRLGLITPEQLTRALTQVTPTCRIGQVLTRAGFVSEANLYSAMTYLVREVLLGMFEMAEGSFLFLEGRLPEAGDVVRLPERTRELVLQGLKRAVAVARLRQRFPEDMRVVTGEEPPPPGEEALFARAAQGATLKELRSLYEGSVYGLLTWVEERVRDGALVIQAPGADVLPPLLGGSRVADVAEAYNAFFAQLYRALCEADENPNLLQGFLESPPEGLNGALQGVALRPDGRVDLARLRRNVASESEELAQDRLVEALDALAAYALFSARNVLPLDVTEQLTRSYLKLQEGLS